MGRGASSSQGHGSAPARGTGFGRQLLRSRWMWMALALLLLANAAIISQTSESPASAAPELSPRSGGKDVLGTWTPMGELKGVLDDSFQGPGLNQAVYALAKYRGDIVAGGLFDDTGGGGNNEADCSDDATFPLQCIAKWTPGPATNAWLPVGGGLNNSVDALFVKGDTLYVGGQFDGTAEGPGYGRCNPSPGIAWTPQTAASNRSWTSVTWGNNTFVAVAASGTGNRVMTSPDGVVWTSQTSPADNDWQSVAWGGPTGAKLFVAVASTGTGDRVMTSPDGVTWTARTSAADNDWQSVVWGGPAGQEKFVAVASSGSGNRVMTSPDGMTWTARTSAADIGWRSVTWDNKFVAVASSGSGNRVMTSPDGISWTRESDLTNRVPVKAWQSVTWGNGRFVAVASDADATTVMTSENGIKWWLRAGSAYMDPWTSVTWAGDMFVAVAPSGVKQVMYSPDGVAWSTRTSGTVPGAWQSVARGNGGSADSAGDDTIVIVGNGSQVMTSVAASSPGTLRCIATWDDTAWGALGGGLGGGVTAMTSFGDDTLLVSGGFNFSTPDATPYALLDGLAAYSGGAWVSPVVGGYANSVYAMLSGDASTVYVGGEYNGDVDDSGITRIRGPFDEAASYSRMGTGFSWINPAGDPPETPGRVDALARLNGTVYAGGYFTATGNGSPPLHNLAAWDATSGTWSTVGAGLNDDTTGYTSVRALASDEARGLLYVGGTFDNTIGGAGNGQCDDTVGAVGPLRCVTVWDAGIDEYIPFQWGSDDDSNGLTGEVKAFLVDDSVVYVGGQFNTWPEGGFPKAWNLKNIGKWTWLPPTGSVSASASSGQTVSITGTRFIGVPSGGVKFGSTTVPFTRSSTQSITATVPNSLASGTYTISVNGVGGWGTVGTVNVTQRSGGGGTPAPTPTPTPTPSPTVTPSASPTPTARPTPLGPSLAALRAVRQVRPDRVPALSRGVPRGRAIVVVDGRLVRSTVAVGPRGMIVRTPPIRLDVQTRSARGVVQRTDDGALSIPRAGVRVRDRALSSPFIQLDTRGYAPVTPVRVFLIPQPTDGPRRARAADLGYLMTDAQGRLRGTVSVRARVAGAYIVQVNGAGSDGRVRSINLPAIVGAPASRN